ncbi:gas vesicle protein [Saccharopolyspora sp. NPDC000359]|uniref:gas vesicle protein n=1 Tax=Saccharopolyspora sp. NPDC000359 TaxID=3154251 RepID=UPI00331F22DE
MTRADVVTPRQPGGPSDVREVALVDLLDRLLAGGVVLTGDVTISLAGVDLVRVSLRAIICSVHDALEPRYGIDS